MFVITKVITHNQQGQKTLHFLSSYTYFFVLLLISPSSVYLYRRFIAKNTITSISKCKKLNFGDFIFDSSRNVHSSSIFASQPQATQMRNVDWLISRLANITFDCDSIKNFVTAKFMYKHTPCLVFPNESVRLKSPREWLLWVEKHINSAGNKEVSIVLEEWALRLSYKNHVIGVGSSRRLGVTSYIETKIKVLRRN